MSLKDFFKVRTILALTLDTAEEINNHLMTIILGGKKLYLSSDSICMDEENMESQLDLYGPELLNSINYSGLPPHKLILKVGGSVMLLRNINQSNDLYIGTRLQVRKLRNHVIECEVLMGNNVGHIVLIPRMNMKLEEAFNRACKREIETPSDQDSGGVPSNGLRTGTVVAENRDSAGGGVAARRRKVAISARWKGRLISMATA
ncbi:uncharacterized protein LOC130939944 [Arachis stenosperma]|uniref:uncharacterized protein LOC130939944 n=1 Tax=Arachis stenosperma TaxID=217475 RepID=UPI0025AD447B|nr:uncharacterized protein LOC130939944 [Arachis stenosperma]